jgi:hypothetical protein
MAGKRTEQAMERRFGHVEACGERGKALGRFRLAERFEHLQGLVDGSRSFHYSEWRSSLLSVPAALAPVKRRHSDFPANL